MTPEQLAWHRRALAHTARAVYRLPGPRYREVLSWIHETLQPATYVEIGVATGATLALAGGARSIGIDPAPELTVALPPNSRVFRMSSDEFFAHEDLPTLLGTPEVALAFIDGHHLFEQALRDFWHLERFVGPASAILIHDCLPLDAETADRTRTTLFHTGDVWKLAMWVHERRPDLTIGVIATAPTGLAIVTGFKGPGPNGSASADTLEYYRDLPFEACGADAGRTPPLIGNRHEDVTAYLRRVLPSVAAAQAIVGPDPSTQP